MPPRPLALPPPAHAATEGPAAPGEGTRAASPVALEHAEPVEDAAQEARAAQALRTTHARVQASSQPHARVVVETPGAALLREPVRDARRDEAQRDKASEGDRIVPRPELVRDVRALWIAVMERSLNASEQRQDNRRLRVLLPDMQPTSFVAGLLTVQTHPSLVLASRGIADELAQLVRRLVGPQGVQQAGGEIRVVIEEPAAAPPAAAQPNPQEDAQRIAEHPLIKHAVELFGGKIVGRQVRKRQEEG